MLSVLTPQNGPGLGGHKESLGGVGYVYYLDCAYDTMGVCLCPSSSNCIY